MDRNPVKIRNRLVALGLGLAIAFSVPALAGTFNLFQPATGILKGNSSTYVTTAAASSDVRALWSGTCNSGTYLRGDGACQAPPGTGGGTVNSVALSAPSVFSVGGSPVTTTGTLALTFATGQTANSFLASPDGTTGAVGLRTIVAGDLLPIDLASTANGGITGTLGVAHGGTGAVTLTSHGVLLGHGTSAVTGLTALSNDQLLLGSTGADPAAVSLVNCGSSTAALAYSTSTHTFSCQTISAGTGTVTSVAQTVPSVFSITGSPVTSSGTLAIDWATGQTANQVLASPNGSTGAVSLRALVGADIPQVNLGTSGNGGVTGNLPVTNLNSGTGASSSTAWFGDGTWKAVSSGAANPSASVGLSAVNGSATTYMRSDGAPALSQSISPTWTSLHTFSHSTTTALDPTLFLSAAVPSLAFRETVAGSNAKVWDTVAFGGSLLYRTDDDTGAGAKNYLAVTRSGAAVTSISLGNATDNNTTTFLGTGAITSGGVHLGPNGSAASPALSFSNDTSTGMYRVGTSRIGLSVGGTQQLDVTTGGVEVLVGQSLVPAGTVGSPGLAFGVDADTGLYRVGANSLGVATGGASYVGFGTTLASGAGAVSALAASTASYSGNFQGAGTATNSGTNTNVRLASSAAGKATNLVFTDGAVWNTFIEAQGDGALAFGVGGGGTYAERMKIFTTGGVTVGSPTGGDQGSGKINATGLYINGVSVAGGAQTTGTFTGTFTGFSGSVTCGFKYRVTGSTVFLFINGGSACTGTSNASTFTITGLPAAIQPSQLANGSATQCQNNSLDAQCLAIINPAVSASTITLSPYKADLGTGFIGASPGNWTASGTKGLNGGAQFTYDLGN